MGARVLVCVLTAALAVPAVAQHGSVGATGSGQMHTAKTFKATGTFKVDVKPVDASEIGHAAGLGRMTIDKVWSGDITGTSKGEMTTSAVGTTMVYVALETMHVSLGGRTGTFVLAHKATMNTGDPKSGVMEITVVPGTGTGELAGIAGTLTIVIDKAGHSYTFDYSL